MAFVFNRELLTTKVVLHDLKKDQVIEAECCEFDRTAAYNIQEAIEKKGPSRGKQEGRIEYLSLDMDNFNKFRGEGRHSIEFNVVCFDVDGISPISYRVYLGNVGIEKIGGITRYGDKMHIEGIEIMLYPPGEFNFARIEEDED